MLMCLSAPLAQVHENILHVVFFIFYSSGEFVLRALPAHDAQREAAARGRRLHAVSAHVPVGQSQRQVWKRVRLSLRPSAGFGPDPEGSPWVPLGFPLGSPASSRSSLSPLQRSRRLQHSGGPVPRQHGGGSHLLHDLPHHPERVPGLHQGFENGP